MKLLPILIAVMTASVMLAGCSGGGSKTDDVITTDPSQLDKGKGAIAGLLIDDRFRPIPNGEILLQELGLETRSNANGEFTFLNIAPGTYRLRANVPNHEAAPTPIDVKEKAFAEINLLARRVINEGGTIITQEFSVFIPCAADYVVNGGNVPCTLDGSNSYSSDFYIDYSQFENVTYVVIEMQANQNNRYEIQHRDGGKYYATANFAGDYVKIILPVNGTADHQDNPGYAANYRDFQATGEVQTIMFVDHAGREELQGLGSPTCCGVGFSMGVKGEFVISIFLGEPEVDINTYAVYR